MTGDVLASDEPETAVARLFEEVRNETWPTRLNSADRAGIDLVMLDASIAGCVTTWLGNGGVLDPRRLGILRRRICDLEQVLPELGEADNPRLWQLWYRIAQLVVDAEPRPTD
ncbi:hypothetical protein [Streptomyces xanthophaeus]|uniref:hypothetical protein n=1 Tax=Streptomyces xanthophaeus TaxID=67385 RepID=UPI0036482FA6